ncbi:MAG: hypothetical protein RL071_4194, partial [Pseudomonadota bacterium]
MALKIKCPHCQTPRRLEQPYPLPGAELHCLHCGHTLAITYPPGMVERLAERGVAFDDPGRPRSSTPSAPSAPPPIEPAAHSMRGLSPSAAPTAAPSAPNAPRAQPTEPGPSGPIPPSGPTWTSPTSPSARGPAPRPSPPPARPAAASAPEVPPRAAPQPTPQRRADGPEAQGGAWFGAAAGRPPAGREPAPRGQTRAPDGAQGAARVGDPPRTTARRPPAAEPTSTQAAPPARSSWWLRLAALALFLSVVGVVAGGVVASTAYYTFSANLPTIDELGRYNPPTVTVVYDVKGRTLGEIYEKRRYVTPLDTIPKHVQDAFLAAEDHNFWTHDGVDYEGILRAFGRNAAKGRKAQGASTITMQVARNFLLSSEKTYERKIREILLSWRIEEAFDKKHILYLYLNQIYLGSGAYGVEAAARTYFGKSVEDITLAEAAILAGLPQRPSDYSPHIHWEKARTRQLYVLGQMRDKGYIDQSTYDAALAEAVSIHRAPNEFLTLAPSFTEHVRRYLVDTYGFDKIYNDGLSVHTTCDLDLQKVAQDALVSGVNRADNLVGWRGAAENVAAGGIRARLDEQEAALRKEQAEATLVVGPEGVGGFGAAPAQSALEVDRRYAAVVTEVDKGHAIVGIGAHEAIIPLSWTKWAYPPNPDRSFKSRNQDTMANVLKVGDV